MWTQNLVCGKAQVKTEQLWLATVTECPITQHFESSFICHQSTPTARKNRVWVKWLLEHLGNDLNTLPFLSVFFFKLLSFSFFPVLSSSLTDYTRLFLFSPRPLVRESFPFLEAATPKMMMTMANHRERIQLDCGLSPTMSSHEEKKVLTKDFSCNHTCLPMQVSLLAYPRTYLPASCKYLAAKDEHRNYGILSWKCFGAMPWDTRLPHSTYFNSAHYV